MKTSDVVAVGIFLLIVNLVGGASILHYKYEAEDQRSAAEAWKAAAFDKRAEAYGQAMAEEAKNLFNPEPTVNGEKVKTLSAPVEGTPIRKLEDNVRLIDGQQYQFFMGTDREFYFYRTK